MRDVVGRDFPAEQVRLVVCVSGQGPRARTLRDIVCIEQLRADAVHFTEAKPSSTAWWLLGLLIASNLSLAMMTLITALRVPRGLAFSTLPTVLLITTLFRLALNVSSTRLILLQADAGRVIRAFGEFVVRGNYAVGAVVFLIITLIQYLVVAKGGERIAEVGARFTLDALPVKQLAIDADLRAGALSPDAARARRANLERESQFYGAMAGAMKFVKATRSRAW